MRGSGHLQLATVYSQVGKGHESRKILMKQQSDLRKCGELGFFAKQWNWILDFTTGFGYALWRTFLLLIAVYLLAVSLVFGVRAHEGFLATGNNATSTTLSARALNAKNCTNEYPCLSDWLYPIDASVPVINFHQSDFWSFNGATVWGGWGQGFFDLLTLIAWGLSSLLIAAGAGLIRRN